MSERKKESECMKVELLRKEIGDMNIKVNTRKMNFAGLRGEAF